MATGIGPIRGDLVPVEISEITREVTTEQGTEEQAIIVLMKRGIAEFFGLDPIPTNDERFKGTFPEVAGNTNSGASYRRNLGGRGDASYKFISAGSLDITEYFYNEENVQTTETRTVKSFTQGFPRGHSVTEIVDWLETLDSSITDKIREIVAPSGRKTPINFSSDSGGA